MAGCNMEYVLYKPLRPGKVQMTFSHVLVCKLKKGVSFGHDFSTLIAPV